VDVGKPNGVGADHAQENIDPGIRMGASPVMLSAAKHLCLSRQMLHCPSRQMLRCAQDDNRGSSGGASSVMLSAAKHLAADPSLRSG
jgi:hypothetical protein